MNYNLKELADTFAKHHEQWSEQQKVLIDQFKENNPGEELPEHFKDDFSLAKSLETICREIVSLKKNSNE
jgi:hypothetical protein